MKFLDIKAEETPLQSSSQTVQDEEVFPPGSLPAQIASSLGTQENISYFPKVDPKSHQVLLVATKEMRGVSSKRISTKGAKHKDLREDNRYYCENCPCNYSRKQLLMNHIMYNCLKTQKDFVCEECVKNTTTKTPSENIITTCIKKNFCITVRGATKAFTSGIGSPNIRMHAQIKKVKRSIRQ